MNSTPATSTAVRMLRGMARSGCSASPPRLAALSKPMKLSTATIRPERTSAVVSRRGLIAARSGAPQPFHTTTAVRLRMISADTLSVTSIVWVESCTSRRASSRQPNAPSR